MGSKGAIITSYCQCLVNTASRKSNTVDDKAADLEIRTMEFGKSSERMRWQSFPMLKSESTRCGKSDQAVLSIQDYALWEVNENGNSWDILPENVEHQGVKTTEIEIKRKKNSSKHGSMAFSILEYQMINLDSKILFANNEAQKKQRMINLLN
ncbi:hypothetical protein Tco_0952289 [Tanacetum coccineum]|uniref:Uncharacterized protein n=1 Tax=Tanacetum coccineum TaxID=301880 RepID=A0ABQ5E2J3_9ASTR